MSIRVAPAILQRWEDVLTFRSCANHVLETYCPQHKQPRINQVLVDQEKVKVLGIVTMAKKNVPGIFPFKWGL